MQIINKLSTNLERGLTMKTKHSWFIVPLAVPIFTTIHYLVAIFFPWVSASLVGPFLGFILISIVFGGWGSSLVGSGILSAYVLIETDYDPWRTGQLIFFSVVGAVMSVTVKQLLIRWHSEAEYYRQKALDTFNGNRARMVEALDNLDKALAAVDIIDVKKFAQIARIKQADTLTLVDSWHEMAKDKRVAIEEIKKAGGYPLAG